MLTGSMRPSARSSASDMGSYAACSLLVGLMAGSDGGVSLCSASSRPACSKHPQALTHLGCKPCSFVMSSLPVAMLVCLAHGRAHDTRPGVILQYS